MSSFTKKPVLPQGYGKLVSKNTFDKLLEGNLTKHWVSMRRNEYATQKLKTEVDVPDFMLRDPKVFDAFKTYVSEREELVKLLSSSYMTNGVNSAQFTDDIISAFHSFAKKNLTQHLTVFRNARRLADLRHLADSYPLARRIAPRLFVAHIGPPNSGKTHKALQEMQGAASGIYAAPLRLLAHEAWTKLNAAGVPCELLTGQERLPPPCGRPATHVACTVEMVPGEREFEVGVVDEIQLIADPKRGSAWHRALCCLAAPTVHLCGDGRSMGLVKEVVESACRDYLSVEEYKRLSPLRVEAKAVLDVAGIREGDCLICNDRPKLIKRRQQLAKLNVQTAVIWGSMPPALRRRQLDLFADGHVHVLLATDAIGLGVNLRINRVILDSLRKFDGEQVRDLKFAEIRQLCGRAGRYGVGEGEGLTATMNPEDMSRLRLALMGQERTSVTGWKVDGEVDFGLADGEETAAEMRQKLMVELQEYVRTLPEYKDLELGKVRMETYKDLQDVSRLLDANETAEMRTIVGPPLERIEDFACELEKDAGGRRVPLSFALKRFAEVCHVGGPLGTSHSVMDMTIPIQIAEQFTDFEHGLARKDLLEFVFAPVQANDPACVSDLRTFAQYYANIERVPLPPWLNVQADPDQMPEAPRTFEGLRELESKWQSLDLYLWLAQKFGEMRFPDAPAARSCQSALEAVMEEGLMGALSMDFSVAQEGDTRRMAEMETAGFAGIVEGLAADGKLDREDARKLVGLEYARAAVDFGDAKGVDSLVKKTELVEDETASQETANRTSWREKALHFPTAADRAASPSTPTGSAGEARARAVELDDVVMDKLRHGETGNNSEADMWHGVRGELVRPFVERMRENGAWVRTEKEESARMGFLRRQHERGAEKRVKDRRIEDFDQDGKYIGKAFSGTRRRLQK